MPLEPENISEWLIPNSLSTSNEGEKIALRFEGHSISYRDLLSRTNQAANFLLSNGVKPREVLVLRLFDSPFFVSVFLGAMKIGAVPALVSTFVRKEEFEHLLTITDSSYAIVENEPGKDWVKESKILNSLKHVWVPSEPQDQVAATALELFDDASFSPEAPPTPALTHWNDPAFFLFTSGSTGKPKAVVHDHADIRHTVECFGKPVLNLTSQDCVFSTSRLFFAYGLGNSFSFPLAARATTILCRERPTPALVAKIFETEHPTVFFSVPAMYRALLEHHQEQPLNAASLRFCVSAGEALPGRIFSEWKERFGVEILDGLGTTEALHMFLSNYSDSAKAGSSGRVVSGYAVRIVDESEREVENGATGNLLVRGESLGYYFDRKEGFLKKDPSLWHATGDIYRRDEAGCFYFCGRAADHFKVQGLWVAPLEIEEALMAHPAVLEAAVVAGMDSDRLIRPLAFVVFREGKTPGPDELRTFMTERLHSYQIPSEIRVLDKLPRTATGKLQRYVLRDFGQKG
ncbi:MAG: benzoate-CoA ligase family protein [Acidobacteriia bacterium]|nr:benzoate-CoA ligase family protein [Terriglobia bacterium]